MFIRPYKNIRLFYHVLFLKRSLRMLSHQLTLDKDPEATAAGHPTSAKVTNQDTNLTPPVAEVTNQDTSQEIRDSCIAFQQEKDELIELIKTLTTKNSELESKLTSATKQLNAAVKQITDQADAFADNDVTAKTTQKKTKKGKKKNATSAPADATSTPTAPTDATSTPIAATDTTSAPIAPADATAPPIAPADATAAPITPTDATSTPIAPAVRVLQTMEEIVQTYEDNLAKLCKDRDASKEKLRGIINILNSVDQFDVSDEANVLRGKDIAERQVLRSILSAISAEETLIETLEKLIKRAQERKDVQDVVNALINFMEMTQSVSVSDTKPSAAALVAGTNTTRSALASSASAYPTLAEANGIKTKPAAVPPTPSRVTTTQTPSQDTMAAWLKSCQIACSTDRQTGCPTNIRVDTQPNSSHTAKVTLHVPLHVCPIDYLGCADDRCIAKEGLPITQTLQNVLNAVVRDNASLHAKLTSLALLKEGKSEQTWNLRACYVDQTGTLAIVAIIHKAK